MAGKGVKIGNVAEGAFVCALGLMIAKNDLAPTASSSRFSAAELRVTSDNVKRLMKKINPEKWVDGGTDTIQIYNGDANLASKAKKTASKLSTDDPKKVAIDTLQVNLTVQLNQGEVEGFFGENINVDHKDWPTLDGIINQMINGSGRYKTVIDRVKQKYLANTRAEFIKVDIAAMGASGALTGGSIKGDVILDVRITPVAITGQQNGPAARPIRLPRMSYSLKASSTPPTTISNQGPVDTISQFEQKFGLNIVKSKDTKLNPTIGNIRNGTFNYVQDSVAQEHNFTELRKARKERKLHLVYTDKKGNTIYKPIAGLYKWDLLDGTKFPDLHPARSNSTKWLRSWVINEYYDKFLEVFASTIPNGVLVGPQADKAWALLIDSAFGDDKAEVISFGKEITKTSTLPYINKLKKAVGGELYAMRSGNNLEFHLPTATGNGHTSSTKLFHVRYKNRTPGTEEGVKAFETAGSLELKMMIEAGAMSYEPDGYTAKSVIEWDAAKKKRIMDGTLLKK